MESFINTRLNLYDATLEFDDDEVFQIFQYVVKDVVNYMHRRNLKQGSLQKYISQVKIDVNKKFGKELKLKLTPAEQLQLWQQKPDLEQD